ncbi:MAG: sodium:proline symporter, partial [Comamonas sp.]|nr:sodium:proline symporter [Candidatus Comamonas equi]
NARRIGMTWMILCLGGAVAVGFFGIAFFGQRPEIAGNVNANAETVFLEATKLLFNPWIAGVLLAAVLAAVMSTLSCQLLVCSSALTQDIYKTFLHKNASDKQLVWFGRAMVFAIAVIAILIAQDPNSKVLGMVSYAWAGFGAAFGPLVLFSLLWKRMTRNGALAGMVVGAVTVLVWKQYGWLNLYEIVPGFILSSIAIVVFSLMGAAPSQRMQAVYEEVEQEIVQHGE